MSEPTDDESLAAQYALVRARVVHEDELINQRLIWMITLNGLLFTAYGFSLDAEGSSLAALVSGAGALPGVVANFQQAYANLTATIATIRDAMTGIGIGSSLAAFVGVVAANRAIRNDQAYFAECLRRHRGNRRAGAGFPLLVGRWSTTVFGMVSSMAVPYLVAGTWMWTIQKFPSWALVSIGLVLALTAGAAIGVLKDQASAQGPGEAVPE